MQLSQQLQEDANTIAIGKAATDLGVVIRELETKIKSVSCVQNSRGAIRVSINVRGMRLWITTPRMGENVDLRK